MCLQLLNAALCPPASRSPSLSAELDSQTHIIERRRTASDTLKWLGPELSWSFASKPVDAARASD